MTPRENFLQFFAGKPHEKIPHSEDFLQFQPEELIEGVARGFVSQEQAFDRKNFGGKDFFGVEWLFDPAAGGSMEVGKLFDDICDWKEYIVFPDLDEIAWEDIAKKNRNYLTTDKIIRTTLFTSYMERLISFVGFENAAMALIDEDAEDSIHDLFDRLSDFYIELIRRMHKYFNVEYFQLHDDWGTQNAPMFSHHTLERMILPHLRKVVDAVHSEGCLFELHSCGQISDFIPDIISLGVDTWCGQHTAVDKPALVRKYGKEFIFGVGFVPDADATEASAREAVKALKKVYDDERVWYFIASTHRPDLIAPIVAELESTPPKNPEI